MDTLNEVLPQLAKAVAGILAIGGAFIAVAFAFTVIGEFLGWAFRKMGCDKD